MDSGLDWTLDWTVDWTRAYGKPSVTKLPNFYTGVKEPYPGVRDWLT